MKSGQYAHEFVEVLPDLADMKDGVVYVCPSFSVAGHRCMCGCGEEVVTPFSPARWSMIFDGRTVSLHPSVGNWGSACGAHYWLRSGDVVWSRSFSSQEIAMVREADRTDLDRSTESSPKRGGMLRSLSKRTRAALARLGRSGRN